MIAVAKTSLLTVVAAGTAVTVDGIVASFPWGVLTGIIAIIGAAIGYGRLSERVSQHADRIAKLENEPVAAPDLQPVAREIQQLSKTMVELRGAVLGVEGQGGLIREVGQIRRTQEQFTVALQRHGVNLPFGQ